MAFVGTIVQAVRGGIVKIKNTEEIENLRTELQTELFDGFDEEELMLAKLKLTEVELERAIISKESRKVISKIEGELINLMEDRIKKMEISLKEENATKLDMANTVLSFQKANRGVKDYVADMDQKNSRKLVMYYNELKQLRTENDNKIASLSATISNLDAKIKENEKKTKSAIVRLSIFAAFMAVGMCFIGIKTFGLI